MRFQVFINVSLLASFPYYEEIEAGIQKQQTNKLRGLSPRANYSDQATAACVLS
jgi:hypothetical protein